MELLKPIALLLAGISLLFGVFSLTAAWFAPKLLATPFMRWMTTGRTLAPNRANQTLMSVWSILLSIYIALSVSGQTILGLLVFAIWLPLGVVVIRCLLASRKMA